MRESNRLSGLFALAGASEEDHAFMENAMARMTGPEDVYDKWKACLDVWMAHKHAQRAEQAKTRATSCTPGACATGQQGLFVCPTAHASGVHDVARHPAHKG